MNFQVKSNYEIKDADQKLGIVTGYASIFGNIDSDRDMVMPGAFTKTITERGPESAKPRIKHLWQHDSFQPIGIPTILKEVDKGLYFETKFGKDQFSQDKLQQHIDGIITELSFGYNTIQKEEAKDEKGETYSKLKELKLWEYSSVTWGANSLTEIVSAKGESKDILAELNRRIEKLNKAMKEGKYSDESCEQFEAELGKIQTIIKSLNVNEPEVSTHEEIKPTQVDTKFLLQTILKTLSNE